jgi:NAD(P)-dependent dehydrogenase (short-subunit alcohol dehydrogenase family)
METVLVIGATGNIGVATVKAVLRSGRHVLAVVRNQDSAKKLFQYVGTQEGISTVEADILSEHGIQGVVEKVESGHLPAFQHVYGAGVYCWMSFPWSHFG